MNKATLKKNVATTKEETRLALQTVYNALNSGQQKQVIKNEAVAALFARYGVEV